jgi:glycosyltransferase involved in cell wall biosynthesis
MGILAEILADEGHNVIWWSSTFDHFNKVQRSSKDEIVTLRENLELRLLRTTSYKRNVSIARMFSYNLLSKRLYSAMESDEKKPDVILCSIPIIELGEKSVEYGKNKSVPVILDMRDMWPDIMTELFPKPLRWFGRILLNPLYTKMKKACRGAFAITGHTKHFVDWGLTYAGRSKNSFDRHFPHGYKATNGPAVNSASSVEFWEKMRIDQEHFNVVFFGGLGRQVEMDTVIDAAIMLDKKKLPIRFIICGSGDYLTRCREQVKELDNIKFTGWIDRNYIDTLISMAHVGLAPYKSKKDFMASLPNKIFEYMSGGLTILSSLKGEVQELLEKENCGITYENNNPESLVTALTFLYENPSELEKMSQNSKNAFNSNFTAEKIYTDMANYLVEVIAEHRKGIDK